VAIGAPYNNGSNNGTDDNGHLRVYNFTLGNWTKLGDDIDGDNAEGFFGHSVDLSSEGPVLVTESPGKNNTKGHDAFFN
jgi:hypothetical protein